MDKLEILNKLGLAKQLTSNPTLIAIVKELTNVKHSYFLGQLDNHKNVELPDIYPSDVELIKPFFGIMQVAIDDEETGKTESIRPKGMLLSVKNIKGTLYVGVAMFHQTKLAIEIITKWSFEEGKLIRVRGFYPNEETHGATLDEVVNIVSPALNKLVKEMIHFNLEIYNFEPTSFSFKKKVPPADRTLYREYRLVRPVSVEEAKDKVEEKQLGRGFVRDTILKNMLKQPVRFDRIIKQLKDSIWFSGITEVITHTNNFAKPDLSHLPFDNFTVIADFKHITKGIISPLMLNVIRSSGGVDIYAYLDCEAGKRPQMDLCYHFKLTNGYIIQTGTIFPLSTKYVDISEQQYRNSLRAIETYIQDITLILLTKFLDLVFNYETEKVTGSFRKNKQKTAEREEDVIAKNVHLVLDMSKRRQYPFTKGSKISGYHMPEHKRIGYKRTSKNGVVHYVKGSTVNEGKGDQYGRVSKEYKL